MTPSVLDNPVFSEAEAARLLGLSQSALHYWLEGGQNRGKVYDPIIRLEATGRRADVTWAEFVEAGLLKEYRKDKRVPMLELRRFIDRLRSDFGVPYPLADRRPWVAGRALVFEAQQVAGLAPDFWLVSETSGQMSLLPAGSDFFRRIVWDFDVASAYRVDGDQSPVVIDPELRFGQPSIRGISTETVWEHSALAGESDEEIADKFDLDIADIDYALAYERRSRALRGRRAA